MGDISNEVRWELMQNDYNNAAVHEISSQTWATSSKIDATIDSAAIILQFIDTEFSAGQTWYLVYSEWNAEVCTARRYFLIEPVSSSFYLSLPDDDDDCNSHAVTIWTNTVENLSDDDYVSYLEFSVNLHNTNLLYLIDRWRFSGSFSVVSGASNTHLYATTPFPVMAGTTTGGGNWTITGTAASFVLEVVYPTGNYSSDTDVATFRVNVEGDITEDFTLRLNVTNGEAVSGTNYSSVTDDDTSLGGDRFMDFIIWGIPNTSVIAVSP